MKYLPLVLAAALLPCALFTGCKKEAKKTTTCTATLYGYSAADTSVYDPSPAVSVGIINPASIALASLGTISTSTYASQAAFNTSDNCYYTFHTSMGSGYGVGTLYRVDPAGAVTSLAGSGGYALAYNQHNNKLYCQDGAGLAEVVVSGTSFTRVAVATAIHPLFTAFRGANTTVDPATGAIYYTTGDTTVTYIEKYVPGSAAPTVVASVSGGWDLLGLRFNTSDNMLYAFKETRPAPPTMYCDFIKINPASGAVATLATPAIVVNPEFYSAAIDPCSNRYYLSTQDYTIVAHTFSVTQLNMSGAIVQHDITTSYFQGLTVKY